MKDMFKLYVLSGPLKDQTFDLSEGPNTIGRHSSNHCVISSEKISKKHCLIQVHEATIEIQDLKSSNGIFVNGVRILSKFLKIGDRVTLGDCVLEVMEVTLPVDHSAYRSSSPPSSEQSPPLVVSDELLKAPTDRWGRLFFFIDHQVMPFFYDFHKKYEWRWICLIFLFIFLISNLFISVQPLTSLYHSFLMKEAAYRAQFMAHEIAEKNTPFLATHSEAKTEIGLSESAPGVRLSLLLDLDQRIIAPSSRVNQYLSGGPEALFALKTKERFIQGEERSVWSEIDTHLVAAIEPVKILSAEQGKNIIVGMALVSVDTSFMAFDFSSLSVIYCEIFIFTAIIGLILFFILYKITLHPFYSLNNDMDKILKGEAFELSHDFCWEELKSLWQILNTATQRISQHSQQDLLSPMNPLENAEKLLSLIQPSLEMIGKLISSGLVLFNKEKKK